jgi:hypothetical protein
MNVGEIRAALSNNECHEEVSRKGWLVPCDKPAVAIRIHEGSGYPVCKYHTRGNMLTLREMMVMLS